MGHPTVRFRMPGAGPGRTPSSDALLPSDVLEGARKRIRVIAVLVLVASSADFVANAVAGGVWLLRGDESARLDLFQVAGNLMTVASAVGMIVAASSRRVSASTLLRTALVFEVYLCTIISLANPAAVYEDTGRIPFLTWATPLIIFFPMIVPCSPRRTLITALFGAATCPLGIAVLSATGKIEVEPSMYLSVSFSPALAVVFAYFGSRVIYGMGMAVAEARQMGSYVLEQRLGRGGMGEVWLGRHGLLARPAAVKLIHPDARAAGRDIEQLLARFEREAQATAALRSPHTVELFDYGVNDEGTFYIVMELLEGLDLDTLVTRYGPMPANRVARVLEQVCHSLGEAHAVGLIHRDIKPANVYVCRYGRDYDFVKVLDFGLVKTPGEAEQAGVLSGGDTIHGTPAFMAPEQATGAEDIDARADIYALGCLAYWMLTGELVFPASNAVAMIVDHVNAEPTPPSERTELSVPAAMEQVVMECLAKDPDDRPGTVDELARRLTASVADAPWANADARSWWKSHRPAVRADAKAATAP